MSKAYRDRGRLHIECDACSSKGATHADTTLTREPGAQIRYDDHVAKATKVHNDHEVAYRAIVALLVGGQITQEDAVERLRAQILDYTTKVKLLDASRPNEREGVTETLPTCPWCHAPLGVTVETIYPPVTPPPMPPIRSAAETVNLMLGRG